jgi:CheY-like chemotaxis protein
VWSAGPSVLVVDEDADFCRNLFDILTDLGYQVVTAPDGPSALELLDRDGYDVALLSWRVPGAAGLTLCRAALAARAGAEVFLLAEAPTDVTQEDARAAGARQVLLKPLNLPRLLGSLLKATEAS